MFTFLIFLSATALADVHFHSFLWKADNSVEVQFMSNNILKTAKGTVKDGDTVELNAEPVSVTVNAFSSSFVGLVFVEAGAEMGSVVILERQNAQYVPITGVLRGRSATVAADFKGSIGGLHKVNRWDSSLALRSMASYFRENPNKLIGDFYDSVELGHIRLVAKPAPKGSPSPKVTASKKSREPRERRESASEGSYYPPPRHVQRDYPGQGIPSARGDRDRSREKYSEPPRRRNRTFIDMLFGG